jgi:hypothetical protein
MYVARWSDGFAEFVKDTGERVIRCVKQILAGVERSRVRLNHRRMASV